MNAQDAYLEGYAGAYGNVAHRPRDAFPAELQAAWDTGRAVGGDERGDLAWLRQNGPETTNPPREPRRPSPGEAGTQSLPAESEFRVKHNQQQHRTGIAGNGVRGMGEAK